MLKSTGIVRKTDELGRIVIPMEIRRNMDIEKKDGVVIYTSGEYIVLQKYQPVCIFCGETGEIIKYRGRNICKNCFDELAAGSNVVCMSKAVSF
mgnify:CR=1 FL=1